MLVAGDSSEDIELFNHPDIPLTRCHRHLGNTCEGHSRNDVTKRLAGIGKGDVLSAFRDKLLDAAQGCFGREVAHISHPLVVEAFADVAIPGITDNGDDNFSRSQSSSFLQRAVKNGPG